MTKFTQNEAKFAELRALGLPLGQYAVTASGPLGIRDIRAISDIDLLLSDQLWADLAIRYPVVKDGEVTKLTISPVIEALGEGSILRPHPDGPSVAEQIAQSEIIDGLPFVRLEHILFFKERSGRPKDAADVERLHQLLAQ